MYKLLLQLLMAACILRGLFVFDMGGSAEDTNTTASAICLVAAVLAAGILYYVDQNKD